MVYKVGDKVWYASFNTHHEIQVLCPVCVGNKVVVVVLGNGDEVEVSCEYCKSGWRDSTGYVTEHVQQAVAELFTITRVRSEVDNSKEEIEYIAGNKYLRPDQMFDTESDALACASSLLADYEKKKQDNPKYKNGKSYSWNAGYHLKAAKKANEEAAHHEAHAKLCKSKSKEK